MPMITTRSAVSTAALLLASFATIADAQVSEYYLVAGDQRTFFILQGGVVTLSWRIAVGTGTHQYPIVVTTTVRTMGADVGWTGAEYDLIGNDLTIRYTHPPGPIYAWDGTTDGLFHYTIDSSGFVYRLDQTWNNPVPLFDAGGIGSLTYDPVGNSLWVSQFSTTNITEYSLSGTVLRSFSTGHSQNMALALDHADGTLWMHDRRTMGTFEQWSKTGQLLSRIAPAALVGQNALGGEMPFRRVARCEFRNGTGINAVGFSCITRPALGGSWTTSFNSNPSTIATILAVGAGGPASGIRFGTGELLLAPTPPPALFIGSGDITVPVPNQAWLIGALISTQGMRIDASGAGPLLELLNAQDVELGR
jgi:hypothetical protein